jgi:hypothetical protein
MVKRKINTKCVIDTAFARKERERIPGRWIGNPGFLEADEVPLVQSRTGMDSDGKGGGIIGQTLEFG